MYLWRKLSTEDQEALLAWRRQVSRPWHSPPHFAEGPGQFHLTAACYEHTDIVGANVGRMSSFCTELLRALDSIVAVTHAWCVLPNHYHLLVDVLDLKQVTAALGRLHGRTSFLWNGEDEKRGRKVWCPPADREIRGRSHYWATVNYIHNNPVKHGWAERWQDWPYSSAQDYLAAVGREEALRLWRSYPLLDYGSGWDD